MVQVDNNENVSVIEESHFDLSRALTELTSIPW